MVCQPTPGKPCRGPAVAVEGQRLQVVDKFTYLGGALSGVVHIDDGVDANLMCANRCVYSEKPLNPLNDYLSLY